MQRINPGNSGGPLLDSSGRLVAGYQALFWVALASLTINGIAAGLRNTG